MSDLALERALLRDRWIVGGRLALLIALAGLCLWRDTVAMARWDESMAAMGMKDMEMEGARHATQARFMTPKTKRSAISIAQQPRQ
jgi:hypothetical protein